MTPPPHTIRSSPILADLFDVTAIKYGTTYQIGFSGRLFAFRLACRFPWMVEGSQVCIMLNIEELRRGPNRLAEMKSDSL